MVVLVPSRVRHAFSRTAIRSSVIGDSMVSRLRSTTIGLLGAVTLVGLGLIAFIAQIGVPGVFNGAIPDGHRGFAAVHGAIALTPSPGAGSPTRRLHQPAVPSPVSIGASDAGPGSGTRPGLGGLKQVGHSKPVVQPPAGHPQSSPVPAPEPTGEQDAATESPAPSAAPLKPESPSQPEKSSAKKSGSKGHSGDTAKSESTAKPESTSSESSKSLRSGKPSHHSGVSPKPTHGPTGKSAGSGSSPSKPPDPPLPSESSEKKSPEDEGKETGNGEKSGKSHH
jgi:hypothetical protein